MKLHKSCFTSWIEIKNQENNVNIELKGNEEYEKL